MCYCNYTRMRQKQWQTYSFDYIAHLHYYENYSVQQVSQLNYRQNFFFNLAAYLFSYHEKAINALYELA